ncbi:MAG TPA: DUF488 family protein [Candidatus Methylomirabilis sp.]|nr:DUF488 family protein [Candidatus Methylomirabilis sp.]
MAMGARGKPRLQVGTMDRVRTKRVAEPATPDDGTRVLVMRLWPRGVRKTAADQWLKGLGTPLDLIRQWKAGSISWEALEKAYLEHLRTAEARADLATLMALARRRRVTLLCSCPDEAHCHRGILKRRVLAALRRA